VNRAYSCSINCLTALSLAVVLTFGVFGQTALAQDKLGKGELSKLIASAKSPAEHQRLAAYYKGEAKRYQAQVDEHQTMIAAYKANPSSKHQASLLTHCENEVTDLKNLSKESDELAQMHQEMASEATAK